MMRQLILILVITSLACLVCLKNGSYLKHLYKELTSPEKWRRVEIVDEKSLFEDLREYSWEYVELLVVGVTACVVSFTIGWSANSIRKGYADFGHVDMLAECLGEHCALHRRIEQLEERLQEVERSGHGVGLVAEKVSSVDCGGGECSTVCTRGELSETDKQIYRSDYNDSCAMTCFLQPSGTHADPSPNVKNSPTLETLEDRPNPTICKGNNEAESNVQIVLESSLETDLEVDPCKLDGGDERVSPGPVSEHPHEVSNECLFSSRSSSQMEMSTSSPKEITLGDKFDENRNCSLDCDVVQEAGESKENASSISTIKVTLDASKTKIGDSTPTSKCIIKNPVESDNSCSYNETQNIAEEKALDEPDPDGDTRTVGVVQDDESVATEVLDVSPSMLTVELVDCAVPRPDSARGNVTRGRIPQYQKLHKEVKSARTSTAPHQYVDELSSRRPSTASGDGLQAAAAAGAQRKKKQKYFAHHPSNKTDAKLS